jgi:peptidoglycan/xylan/chitin deacetylase (PgdA/CDA1 family)
MRLAERVDRLGLVRALKPFHDRGRKALTVLAYHRVSPVDAGGPLDRDLVSATPESFEWQMRWLRERMTPVSLSQVIAHIDGTAGLPDNAVAVTFDDGFADTWRYAFPALRRHSIPATVFVITGPIENGEPFWFELAAYLMARLPPGSIRLDEIDTPLPTGPSLAERRASLGRLHHALKTVSDDRRASLVARWHADHAALLDRSTSDVGWPMTWQQVREMADAGIGIGSHTATHPNLALLDDGRVMEELSASRRMLEEKLQRPVTTFAYPFGTRSAYDARVVECVKRAGFRLAVSYRSGANWAGAIEPFELRRIGVGLPTSDAQFRVRTALPQWFG